MKYLLYFFLGYSIVKVNTRNIKDIMNAANRLNIKILAVKIENDIAAITISSRDESFLTNHLKEARIEIYEIVRRGALAILKKYRHRAGMILGIILLFTAMYISPLFVWEINVVGNEKLSREYICKLVENEGVYIGAFSPRVDRKALYRNILRGTNDISWIAVNFIGSSANVEVVERDYTDVSKKVAEGANIVAKKDGKIVDANVIRGRLACGIGGVVKKGDILVSGVYDTKKSGTRFVYSDAEVFATVFDEYSVEVPLKNTSAVYKEERAAECSLKMFGKSVNIFKNYSNLDDKYDTIVKSERIPITWLDRLPISLETTFVLPYSEQPVILTADEAKEKARSKFLSILDCESEYVEILSIEEDFTIENDVVILKCNVEAVENIAATAEFDAW